MTGHEAFMTTSSRRSMLRMSGEDTMHHALKCERPSIAGRPWQPISSMSLHCCVWRAA